MKHPVFLAALLLSVCLPFAFADAPTVAIVNNQRISENDLQFMYLSRRVPDAQKAAVRERFVDDLIDRALLKQFLDKRKAEFSQELLEQQVTRIESIIKGDGKNVNEVLRSLGYNRETLKQELALPLRWRTYAVTLITDKAIQDYWNANRSQFDGTEVRAAQIVKKLSPQLTSSDQEKSKQALVELRGKIVSKQLTFEDAAKQHSESPSAASGGDIGSFSYRGSLPLELTQVAFRLKVGEISEPFQTSFGVHLIKVLEITPGDLSLEDARPEIFDVLSQETQRRLVKELRTTAKIEKK